MLTGFDQKVMWQVQGLYPPLSWTQQPPAKREAPNPSGYQQ